MKWNLKCFKFHFLIVLSIFTAEDWNNYTLPRRGKINFDWDTPEQKCSKIRPLACGACKSCKRPGFESRVKRASLFKKSQTSVSTNERYMTLSVVCLIVECTRRQLKGNSIKHSDSCRRLGWKWIEGSVQQLFLPKLKNYNYYWTILLLFTRYNKCHTINCLTIIVDTIITAIQLIASLLLLTL